MRLLDSVAHCPAPASPSAALPSKRPETLGPSRFAAEVAGCPLRFVLGDDLTRACAELAFADGARLVGCLDLLHMPAPQMWLEWNDEVHKRVIHETQSAAEFDSAAKGRKVGVLLQASADGLTALARTFWADAAGDESADLTLSPLETHFDLQGQFADAAVGQDSLSGGFLDATHGGNSGMAGLLGHVRFRFDDLWAGYYRDAAKDAQFKRRLIVESIKSIAWDAPFIIAFLLLLSAKDATRSLAVSRAAINRKRLAHGRAPLLDHIEVNAALDAVSTSEPGGEPSGRHSPRLHHVRGHLVRREHRVFWRVPHLRGSAVRGAVRSRTVCLAFSRKA
ncbi:MAG TPA: hypothetical protein VK794_13085 [Steroidobacteraceae bacterium]|jgi:hypothetical protein|nr:hypothetical protein [Steroidobacteraceae bacterium]